MESTSPPEDKFIRINHLSLHYLDWDRLDAVPMILLHGLCGNAHYWDFFALNMRNDYHVLALDQRGHGDSGWAESYGPRDYALDLDDFVAKLGLQQMVLVGHSIGGINAVIYAARHPDQVTKLVIIDIGPEIRAAGAERILRQWDSVPEAFGSMEEAIRYLKQAEPRYSDDFVQNQIKHALRQNEQGKLKFKYDRALHRTELRSPEWLWEYLEQVICPTLVMHGMESDMLLPGTAKRVGDTLAFGQVVDIDGASHSVPGDNPEAFELAVRKFLRTDTG